MKSDGKGVEIDPMAAALLEGWEETSASPPDPEAERQYVRQQRREDRARAAVTSKAKKVHADLLRLERFALRNDVIFMPFHEALLASVHYFEQFLSDYDPGYLTDYQPHPFDREPSWSLPPGRMVIEGEDEGSAGDAAPELSAAAPEDNDTPQAAKPPSAVPPDEVLSQINRRMSALSLGECAIVSHRGGNSYTACLYPAARFRESATVAGWFHDLGATSVVIDHTLYSDTDGDRGGLTHGCQAWTVYFDLASNEEPNEQGGKG